MKYYKVWGSNGYCGCDFEDYICAETWDDANQAAYEMAMDNAESYEHVAFGWDEEPSEEDREFYYENVDYGLQEISEEEYNEHMN